MLELGLKTLIGYFLGSIVGALVVGCVRGVDIRTLGSGNAGATNALRTQGAGFAAATAVIDVGKGWIAAALLPALAIPGVRADPAVARDWLAACCAAAAVTGHVWPIFFGFRGGKGGATLVGTLLGLAPVLLLVAVSAWCVILLLSGFVGLATSGAAVAAAIGALNLAPASGATIAFTVAVAALVAFAHRSNFARIRAGSEPRHEKLWLLKPRKAPR